jgi:hypothetical protein
MDKKDFGGLACKILGIFLIIQGINMLSNFLYHYFTTPEILADGLASGVAYSSVYIGGGVLLWLFAGKLSAMMVSRSEACDRGEGISAGDLQRIAFSVLGLYFIGNTLPRLASSVANLANLQSFYGRPPANPGMIAWTFVGPIVELLIGIGLFFGSQGLVNLLTTLRKAGPASSSNTQGHE